MTFFDEARAVSAQHPPGGSMKMNVIESDVAIVGAGSGGLFAVFGLGLLDLKC